MIKNSKLQLWQRGATKVVLRWKSLTGKKATPKKSTLPKSTLPKSSKEEVYQPLKDKGARPQLRVIEEPVVHKLHTDPLARFNAKSLDPKVLDFKPEVEDLEGDWGIAKFTVPVRWFVLAAAVILGFSGWAVVGVFQAQPEIDATAFEKRELRAEDERESAEVHDSLLAMEACVRGYLAAGSADAMLPLVRHPDRVGPLIGSYYKSHKRWRRRFSSFALIRSVSVGTGSFVLVVANTEDGAARTLFLEQGRDATFRVDWESDVLYQPLPWRDYLHKRPLASVDMRVLVKEDYFYGFAFRDSERYQCYKLTTVGSDDYLFGYVERGSDVAKKIEQIVKNGGAEDVIAKEDKNTAESGTEDDPETGDADVSGDELHSLMQIDPKTQKDEQTSQKPQPMILRLRFLRDDASMRCVKIDALMAKRWIYENSPEPLADVVQQLAQHTPFILKPSAQPNLPSNPVSGAIQKKKPEPSSPPSPIAVLKIKKDPALAAASKITQAPKTTEPKPKKLAPEPKPTKSDSGRVYIVKGGDSLSQIAKRYNVRIADVIKINGIKNPNKLSLGQKIKISAK